jgi:hypothetical protein
MHNWHNFASQEHRPGMAAPSNAPEGVLSNRVCNRAVDLRQNATRYSRLITQKLVVAGTSELLHHSPFFLNQS